jgi:hypothetical protein
MSKELIAQLNEPEIHFPENFDTVKRANAMLQCLCQEAADLLESQAAKLTAYEVLVAQYESDAESQAREIEALKNAAYPATKARWDGEKFIPIEDELRAALVEAVEALSLPCDRWNKVQYMIVQNTLTRCKEVLK